MLAGIALGVCFVAISEAFLTPPILLGAAESGTRATLPSSIGITLGFWCYHALRAVGGGLSEMFVLNGISAVIRRKWVAVAAFVLLMTVVFTPYVTGPRLAVARAAVLFTIFAFVLIRFGVLAVSAIIFTQFTLWNMPLTTNWSAWYAQSTLLTLCILIGLALYGFYTTLAGRPLKNRYL